jgi:hypothetical protein
MAFLILCKIIVFTLLIEKEKTKSGEVSPWNYVIKATISA